jgi:DEAD/DEAH box helicase domain-containing protein
MDLIIAYCKQDVDVTRRIYEFALANGHLLYESRAGIKTVNVSWSAPALPEKPAAPAEQLSLLE